jgi:hypothetical protein
VIDFIDNDATIFEKDPMENLAERGRDDGVHARRLLEADGYTA